MRQKDLMRERAAEEGFPHRQQRNGHLNSGLVAALTQKVRNDLFEEIGVFESQHVGG